MEKFASYLQNLPSTPVVEAVRAGYHAMMEGVFFEPDNPTLVNIVTAALKLGYFPGRTVSSAIQEVTSDMLWYGEYDPKNHEGEDRYMLLVGYCRAAMYYGDSDEFLSTGSFTDERDGNTYRTMIFDGKEWLGENLRYETEYGCVSTPNGCYYRWDVANDVIPDGWRLPQESECRFILDNMGNARGSLPVDTVGGDSLFGFDVTPHGFYNYGSAGIVGTDRAEFWTATTKFSSSASIFCIAGGKGSIISRPQKNFLNIRCVREVE